ncbi:hypothetical protein LZK79_29330 (plasmid) [Rhizobium leguminosarum]|nr:hypothetical protein LZK79_29330 [Rhizobium leguminosarum]
MFVRMADWVTLKSPAEVSDAATDAGPNREAQRVELSVQHDEPLPMLEGQGSELIEALFLEDRVPISVFGSEKPELLTLRLLTAVWPSFRRKFSVSTFCKSPRTISKRSFDLVFAPVDARSRFADWSGRKIDGRRAAPPRHHWAAPIAERVFHDEQPSLLSLDALGEMKGDSSGSEQALRVSLLWDELIAKSDRSPHAALGLLDIANTRSERNFAAIRGLEPVFAKAASTAVETMTPDDAWHFLVALTDKLSNTKLALRTAKVIRSAARHLAERNAVEAIAAVPVLMSKPGREFLLSAVADGISRSISDLQSLRDLPTGAFLELLIASPSFAERALLRDSRLDEMASLAVIDGEASLDVDSRRRLLRCLVRDSQADAMGALLRGLPGSDVIAQVERLFSLHRLNEPSLNEVLVRRAKEAGMSGSLRDELVRFDRNDVIDGLLLKLIAATTEDVSWLLASAQLDDVRRRQMLVEVLASCSPRQLSALLQEPELVSDVLSRLSVDAEGSAIVLGNIGLHLPLEATQFVMLFDLVAPHLDEKIVAALAERSLRAVFADEMVHDRERTIISLLARTSERLDIAAAYREALFRKITPDLASRNLIAFDRSQSPVRRRFLHQPESLVRALMNRPSIDLTTEAVQAAANLLWDSGEFNRNEHVKACATILPVAMRQRSRQTSPLIAAAFPAVYHQLQEERIPDFLGFVFIFIDWDRCKSARRELIDAFEDSSWSPLDIALAAARSDDASRILKRLAGGKRGERALGDIRNGLSEIPLPWRLTVESALNELARSAGSDFDA